MIAVEDGGGVSDASERGRLGRERSAYQIEGHGVLLAPHADEQHLDDGEGERQSKLESGSASERGLDVHRSLQTRDRRAHDVHAHSATTEVAHRLRRREPRVEDQVDEL